MLAFALAGCADDTAQPTSASESSSGPGAGTSGETTGVDPTTGMASTGDPTGGERGLCARLGGPAGAEALAGRIGTRVTKDPRVNAYFLNTGAEFAGKAGCLAGQIAVFAGCEGATYTCLEMQAAHAGLGISALDFADFVEDVAAALEVFAEVDAPTLTAEDRAALVGSFAAVMTEVVEDPGSDATLYQRIGRKPAIRTLVGAPGLAGSWLARVAGDAALAGFFGAADWERLGTCLVRQVAAIDGPAVYGAEVDPPPGIEPGVGAGAPCLPMAPVHAGVTDGAMAPIEAVDFVAMLGHLAATLAAAGVADDDAAALVGAFEPLCPEIAVDDLDCPGFTETQSFEATELGRVVEDGFYDGTPASMTCHEIAVPADGIDFVTAVEVEVGVDTGYAGDLTIKLVAPGGEVVTLVSRPGFAEPADDGESCSGDSSNLAATSPLVFRTGGDKDAELMGDGLDSSGTICQDDGACSYAPNPGAAQGPGLAALAGTAAPGSWAVCVGDSCGGFTATLQAVRLHLAQQKAP